MLVRFLGERSNEEVCLVEAVIVTHFETDVWIAAVPVECTFIVSIEIYFDIVTLRIWPVFCAPCAARLEEFVLAVLVVHGESRQLLGCESRRRASHHLFGFPVAVQQWALRHFHCKLPWLLLGHSLVFI